MAQIRLTEIVQFCQSVRYERHPPEWRQVLDLELQRMQQAVAPPPQPMPAGGAAPEQPPPPEAVASTPPTIDPANPPLDNPVLTGQA